MSLSGGTGRKMPTGDPHGDVVLRVALALGNYTENSDYGVVRTGEPGYRLDREPDTVRAPDVAWIAPERMPEGAQGYPEFTPDLVVEVKSPSNSNAEMTAEAAMWLCYGSRQVWVLDPQDTTVAIHRPNVEPVVLTEDAVIDDGDLLPGFISPVWRLFPRRR